MGVFDKFKAAFGRKDRQGSGFEVSRWRAAPVRRGSAELILAYKEMPWLRTVVDTVGEQVAAGAWKVCRRVDKRSGRPVKDYSLRSLPAEARRERMKQLLETGEAVEVPDHPALELLCDPNDFLTGHSVHKLQQTYLDLVGEAFFILERVGTVPVGMWPVPPHWVLRLPDLSLPPEQRFYSVRAGTVYRNVPAADVIHMRHLDPDDPLGRGCGAAFALGDELDTDEYIARFVKTSFYNNMLPASVVSIEGMNDTTAPAAKAFKESLERAHKGPDNGGKLLMASGKVTFARLDTTFKDMALVDLRKFLMGFIRMTYRVPPEIVGDISSSNKATAFAARENLAEQATVPRMEFLRTHYQKWLMPLFGDDAILDYESPVPADRELQLRVMGLMPSGFSYDEWRRVAGFKPDPQRQGYPMPMPGQKPEDDPEDAEPTQTPAPTPGSSAEADAEAEAEKRADPPWAGGPIR